MNESLENLQLLNLAERIHDAAACTMSREAFMTMVENTNRSMYTIGGSFGKTIVQEYDEIRKQWSTLNDALSSEVDFGGIHMHPAWKPFRRVDGTLLLVPYTWAQAIIVISIVDHVVSIKQRVHKDIWTCRTPRGLNPSYRVEANSVIESDGKSTIYIFSHCMRVVRTLDMYTLRMSIARLTTGYPESVHMSYFRMCDQVIHLNDDEFVILAGQSSRTIGDRVFCLKYKHRTRAFIILKDAPYHAFLYGHACIKLLNGNILVTGGVTGMANMNPGGPVKLCWEYNPQEDAWIPAPPMAFENYYHGIGRLPSGDVITVGGRRAGYELTMQTCQVFDSRKREWIRGPDNPDKMPMDITCTEYN